MTEPTEPQDDLLSIESRATPGRLRQSLSWLPNAISIGRIVLTLPIAWLLIHNDYTSAMILVLIAGVSDALDGFLAKRFGWMSQLGGILDPVADKLLLIAAYAILGWQGHILWWVAAIVLLRDFGLLTSGTYYHFRIRKMHAKPSIISKINTVLQIGLALLVLLALAEWFTLANTWLFAVSVAVFVSTLLSGVDYLWNWGQKAVREHRENTHTATPHNNQQTQDTPHE